MKKNIKIYKSFQESKDAEIEYKFNLSYKERLEIGMDLIRKVYAKQILENKKSKRITIISGK